ncbi:hypothetical protein HA402_004710 [Bradysia odoriphaga]|nr:hypothetical protein HA402_004710 [Bradysia odoriphaga]
MYKLSYFILLATVIFVSGRRAFDNILGEEWQLFKLRYAKVYPTKLEELHRNKIFLKNKLEIIQHNNLYELGQVSFRLGLNEYSDLEYSEFITRMNGGTNTSIINIHQFQYEAATFIKPDIDVPSSVDWSKKGAVTAVKNQAQCGSCWAFSSTGALEGQYFRKTGKLISLSEQNLVDCTRNYGNNGCGGGWMGSAFEYIKNNGGIETEQSYPYEARDANCRYDSRSNSGATVKGSVGIQQGDENSLKMAVATYGPIAVAIDASVSTFGHYREGVYYASQCDPGKLTHAVLVVGYDTTANGQDYWIVKNSWGTSWGQSGYIFMARNKGNNCGIATAAIFPLV